MVSANENLGNYKEAFYEYKNFSKVVDSIHLNLFENKIQFSEDEHKLQLKAKKEADEKRLMIKEFIGIFILLLMALLLLLQAYRSNKSKKELATQKLKSASLENENLRLEREKKVLETENLRHQINDLKTERTNLKNIIKKHDGLSEQVQETIRIRIDMLNALMASQITSNDQFEKSYNVWIKELIADSTNFMNKNRLAFKGSHPQFINYFEDKGLTNDEINYVCLYAIGLRGKEVGAYMNRPSHINLSSTIRKKLGIDKHETNLGIYVRRLLQTL
jgi:DNA gyrase/topoisomerase IV subunit A